MILFRTVVLLPPPGGPPRAQARACLDALLERLPSPREALALAFFTDAETPGTFLRRRAAILDLVAAAFGPEAPPASVVAQAPEGGRSVALEAFVLHPAAGRPRVSRRSADGVPYTVVSGGGVRQVHGAGVAARPGKRGAAAQAADAFARMHSILAAERMTFGHVVRQWGYVEGLLEVRSGSRGRRQGYQAFNDERTLAYDRSGFPAGYPAATGIGQAAGGIVLDFVAFSGPPEVRVEPVSNPRQTDAHRYSDGVLVGDPSRRLAGRSPPKFERAKRVVRGGEEVLLVSGTAAVLGEASVAPGDVAAQTRTTIENIAALGGSPPSSVRGYVKRARDIPKVRRVCEEAWGPAPSLFVRADVCRAELLVEIEGMRVVRPDRPGGGK